MAVLPNPYVGAGSASCARSAPFHWFREELLQQDKRTWAFKQDEYSIHSEDPRSKKYRYIDVSIQENLIRK